MSGRTSFQPRSKPQAIIKLRELGFLVEQQHETISMLLGLVVALTEEVDTLKARVTTVERRQPTTFA